MVNTWYISRLGLVPSLFRSFEGALIYRNLEGYQGWKLPISSLGILKMGRSFTFKITKRLTGKLFLPRQKSSNQPSRVYNYPYADILSIFRHDRNYLVQFGVNR